MNLGEIKTRVKRQFGDESGVQVTDGDIVRWVNDGQRDIVNQNEGILEEVVTANSVVGQQLYALPTNLLVLRGVTYKSSSDLSYYQMRGRSMQQFNIEADGWDGSQWANNRQPQLYSVWKGSIRLFPVPDENQVAALKIYYQRMPVDVALDGDIPDLPLQYHNAVVNYCLSQAYELDEDWDSAGNKAQAMSADITANREREKWGNQEFYPTITTMPWDEDWGY